MLSCHTSAVALERLTQEEIATGWHWCREFDSLLVGPGMGEQKYCTCNDELDNKHS